MPAVQAGRGGSSSAGHQAATQRAASSAAQQTTQSGGTADAAARSYDSTMRGGGYNQSVFGSWVPHNVPGGAQPPPMAKHPTWGDKPRGSDYLPEGWTPEGSPPRGPVAYSSPTSFVGPQHGAYNRVNLNSSTGARPGPFALTRALVRGAAYMNNWHPGDSARRLGGVPLSGPGTATVHPYNLANPNDPLSPPKNQPGYR